MDVREVAFAHLQALKVPEARNQRFILASESLWFKEVADAIKARFSTYPVVTREIGYCPIKVASWFDSTIKLTLPFWNKVLIMDNKRSKDVLGV